jgi:hypothetical protein
MVNLHTLSYKPASTNLSLGTCSTVDFVVLLLGQSGPMSLSAIYTALSSWRAMPLNRNGRLGCASHLFNRVYGYVSQSYNASVPWSQFFIRSGTNTRSLWYRVSPGVYALNSVGRARFNQLTQ